MNLINKYISYLLIIHNIYVWSVEKISLNNIFHKHDWMFSETFKMVKYMNIHVLWFALILLSKL